MVTKKRQRAAIKERSQATDTHVSDEHGDVLPLHMVDPEPTTRYDKLRLFAKKHTPYYLHEPFVQSGYRVNLSFKACCKSMFQAHNETGNIWTHFLGATIFVFIFYYTMKLVPALDLPVLQQVRDFGQEKIMELKATMPSELDLSKVSAFVSGMNLTNNLKHFANLTSGYCHDSAHDLAEYIMKTPVGSSLSRLSNATITSANDLAVFLNTMDPSHLESPFHMDQLREVLTSKLEEIKHLEIPQVNWQQLRRDFVMDTEGNPLLPRWPMMYYTFTAFMCMLLSTIFHTFGCVSYKWYSWGSRLDYAGISLLISGSSVPFHYYGFHGSALQIPCVVGVIFFGVLGMVVLSLEIFNSERFRTFRTFMFLGLAGVVGVPMMLQLVIYGFDEPRMVAVKGIVSSGSLYILGVIVFLSRYPERATKHKFFELWCTSHQIWHVLVFCAAIAFYRSHISFWRAMMVQLMESGMKAL